MSDSFYSFGSLIEQTGHWYTWGYYRTMPGILLSYIANEENQ